MRFYELFEQAAPQTIKPIAMPTPPTAPTGPDGTADDGSVVGPTQLGNRSVQNDAGGAGVSNGHGGL